MGHVPVPPQDGCLPGALCEPETSPETKLCPRMTLGELLSVFEDLLPLQVDLCADLVGALRKSERISASFISADSDEIENTFASVGAASCLVGGGVPRRAASKVSQQDSETSETLSKPHLVSNGGHRRFQSDDSDADACSCLSACRGVPKMPPSSLGGLRYRIFLVFDDPSVSLIGKVTAFLLIVTIFVSTVAFVVETMPAYQYTPPECAISRSVSNCQPRPHDLFFIVEAICIIIFTVDYVMRVALVHSSPQARSKCLLGTLLYMVQPLNIVDLLAVIPFYVDLAIGGGVGAVKILRLVRILRPFKAAKQYPGLKMLADVLLLSGRPLMILLFFNAIIAVLFGSLIYFAEGMRFSVDPRFTAGTFDPLTNSTTAPLFRTGVFVRPSTDAWSDEDEATPFRSIPYSIWWVLVTMTTVGYGDYAPSSVTGKAIGVMTFYVGIIFLALPISVLGTNFELVYREMNNRTSKRKLAEDTTSMVRKDSCRHAYISAWGSLGLMPKCIGVRAKIFILFEESSASKLGKWLSICMIILILISTGSFIMESMEAFSDTPPECTMGELTVENCQPRPLQIFYTLEVFCIVAFSIEYVLRIATVHVMAAQPEICGIQPKANKERHSGMALTVRYCAQWLNLIDLLAIVPFYIECAGGSGGGTGVLRVLRLVRIFRVLKMPKMRACVEMFINVIVDALPALFLLFFMTTLMCVLYASLIVFAEGSHYTVEHFVDDPRFPTGLYIRPTKDGYGIEPSPFRSIVYAFWWFFTTATTVGFGDDFPTTTAGRIIAVCTFYTGIVLIALPITIINGCFNEHYPTWVKDFGPGSENAVAQTGTMDIEEYKNSEDAVLDL